MRVNDQKKNLQAVDLQQSDVVTVADHIVPLLMYDRLLHLTLLQQRLHLDIFASQQPSPQAPCRFTLSSSFTRPESL